MFEADTIVFTLLLCAAAVAFPFLRAMMLKNSIRIKAYLDKVDPEQEMIPVDDSLWYYHALKRQHIKTYQELNSFLVRGLQETRLMDSVLRIFCYSFLACSFVVYAFFVVSLIFNTDETKVNIALLLGASFCIIGYLVLKTLLDNSKAIHKVIMDYLEEVPESIMIPREK